MEKDWLDSKSIQHKVVMVDINPYEAQKVFEKTGQMGVPVTEIEYESGNLEFIVGFDQKKLSDILGVN